MKLPEQQLLASADSIYKWLKHANERADWIYDQLDAEAMKEFRDPRRFTRTSFDRLEVTANGFVLYGSYRDQSVDVDCEYYISFEDFFRRQINT